MASTDLYLIPVLALMRRCSVQVAVQHFPHLRGKGLQSFGHCYRDHFKTSPVRRVGQVNPIGEQS